MAKHVYSSFNSKKTPQTQPIPGKDMVKMRSGGYGFKVGDWEQLRRFLTIGTIGGTFYASAQEMTSECVEVIQRCLQEDGDRTVNMIIDVSIKGLALKNDHALFALAMAVSPKHSDEGVRNFALTMGLPQVARTGTHLFMFLEFVQQFRGWGRALKNAVADWYNGKDLDKLAYQAIKYRQRNGWTHRDVLRLAHPKASSVGHNMLYQWITQGQTPEGWDYMPQVIKGFLNVQDAAKNNYKAGVLANIVDYRLPREAIPTEYLNDPDIWSAMLEVGMPMTAMVRNLGVMTANGTLKPFSANVEEIVSQLHNPEAIQRSRIHPIQVLFALKTYTQGRGFRGSKSWEPIPAIIDALDDAYYLAFDNVEATDKNMVLGVDVSGSMAWTGDGILKCSEYAAAMAMVTVKSNPNTVVKAFSDELKNLPISPKSRLDDVVNKAAEMTFGATDPAVVIKWAANNGIPVDVFGFYSDGEAWAGKQHVMQALEVYRNVMHRPNTKLYCVNFVATSYSFADSSDPLCLNIVGNSPDVAQAIVSFIGE